MTPSQPTKKVATVCRAIPISKILSGAAYGVKANIYRPSTIADMELSTPQCLLLALLYALVKGDVRSCILLADICHQVEKLRSRHLKVWLSEDFSFPRTDIEEAMALLVKLVADGILKLPAHVLGIMSSLANMYRISGVQLVTLSEEYRCNLAIQLENAVANNSPRDIFELESEGADVNGSTQSGDSLLHLAARAGSSASIAALGILNADLEYVNFSNATPLKEAVKLNCASSVKALLMAGAKFDKRMFAGDTYLHIAAAGFHNEALEVLLEGRLNVNETNHHGETPLVQAVIAGNFRGIELLLKKGADSRALPGIRLNDGDSIIHSVARSGNIEVLKLLKERMIPANIKNRNGLTPLHVARNPAVVRVLLKMGMAMDTKDNVGSTPLMIAAKNRKADIVNLLLLNGANHQIKDNEGWTALHYAAEGGCAESVTFLLDAGAEVDDLDNKGDTPAFIAAASNKPSVLQLLVENGADLTLWDCNSDEILHREACSGHFEVVTALLNAGVAVDMRDEDHKTALHRAAEGGHATVVTALLNAGAVVDMKDQKQDTPLHHAAAGGHTAVVVVLLDRGADPAASADAGITPLMAASHYGHLAVVQLLVDRRAPVNAMNDAYWTALRYANNNNHVAVADYLRSRGGVE